MDSDQLRFVCKLCDKKYPCAKSLGGHMRSHVIAAASANSAESDEFLDPEKKVSPLVSGSNLKRELGTSSINVNAEIGGASGYGLRENPKKTWRAVDSTNFPVPSVQMERICKQCGKGFQSLKALCGHMACHSEKERVLKDDHSWTSESGKLVMDSHSDTEAEDQRRLTRSKSKRYKRLVVKSSHFNLGNTSTNNNGSNSSVSEIDEQEQEEVAMCLMMLSRDSGNWGGVNSVVESSDNNSVVLETKSSSIDMKIGRKAGGLNFGGGETLQIKKIGGADWKLKSSGFDAESVHLENSYSGYFRNGVKKVESDISVDELLRYGTGGYKKQQPNARGEVEVFDDELGKAINKGKSYETGLSKGFTKEKGFGEVGSSSKSVKYDPKKGSRDDSDSTEFRRKESLRKLIYDSSDGEFSKKLVHKKSKYECLNCNKTFNSHQALGGHRPCHRKNNAAFASRYGSGENSLEDDDDITPDSLTAGKLGERLSNKKHLPEKKVKSKKSKGHECPFCFRMFKSGQALGGHKRSHFINGSEDYISRTPVLNQEAADDIHDFNIDLNLPAPEEDEADDNNHFIY